MPSKNHSFGVGAVMATSYPSFLENGVREMRSGRKPAMHCPLRDSLHYAVHINRTSVWG
jgi:hypothetical protein